MFTLGYRPETRQRVALGAAKDGTLQAIIHEATAQTSRFEDYAETVTDWSGMFYQCDNVRLDHRLVSLDLNTPTPMRAPGAVLGIFALECAMDELAAKLGLDPVDLRLRNYAERDQNEKRPFSSKELRECYRQGAERIGWSRRQPEPRSTRVGHQLRGLGMAGGAWEASQMPAGAQATLTPEGRLTVGSGTADIGPGTYTIMTQIAAEMLGLPLDAVSFRLGDSSLPKAPVEGGSFTAATVGSAVKAVREKLQARVLNRAQKADGSPLAQAELKDVEFAEGELRLRAEPSRKVGLKDVLSGLREDLKEEVALKPDKKDKKYSSFTHSAVFAEVEVDEDFGTVRVLRLVNAVAAGRILNPKTARSQVLGALVMGIGMALQEESVLDHKFGRFMNHNFAEYHVPVNADVQELDVIFVEEKDEHVNPIGVKGLGEIGIVGVASAIANAVYNATGRRLRELPLTLEKLI